MITYVIRSAFGDVVCTCGHNTNPGEGFTTWPEHQQMHRDNGDECVYPWELEQ